MPKWSRMRRPTSVGCGPGPRRSRRKRRRPCACPDGRNDRSEAVGLLPMRSNPGSGTRTRSGAEDQGAVVDVRAAQNVADNPTALAGPGPSEGLLGVVIGVRPRRGRLPTGKSVPGVQIDAAGVQGKGLGGQGPARWRPIRWTAARPCAADLFTRSRALVHLLILRAR